jgi:hypothetical protein
MQIDWVNLLATVTVGSVAISAILGLGSLITYKVMQAREAARARVRR